MSHILCAHRAISRFGRAACLPVETFAASPFTSGAILGAAIGTLLWFLVFGAWWT